MVLNNGSSSLDRLQSEIYWAFDRLKASPDYDRVGQEWHRVMDLAVVSDIAPQSHLRRNDQRGVGMGAIVGRAWNDIDRTKLDTAFGKSGCFCVRDGSPHDNPNH